MRRTLCFKCEIVYDRWCPDCIYVDDAVWEARVAKGVQLRDWCKQDDDVQHIVANVCASNGVLTYAELAERHPAVFDELYQTVADLLEESPSIGHLPGFMQ